MTVYLTGASPFWHREVCLEWFDGHSQVGTHIAAHLTTPALATGSRMEKIGNQLKSLFPGGERMTSVVSQHGDQWDPNRRAQSTDPENRKTVALPEAAKEAKRQRLAGEIGKTFEYDLYNLGWFGNQDKQKNCEDWARDVAPEAII